MGSYRTDFDLVIRPHGDLWFSIDFLHQPLLANPGKFFPNSGVGPSVFLGNFFRTLFNNTISAKIKEKCGKMYQKQAGPNPAIFGVNNFRCTYLSHVMPLADVILGGGTLTHQVSMQHGVTHPGPIVTS